MKRAFWPVFVMCDNIFEAAYLIRHGLKVVKNFQLNPAQIFLIPTTAIVQTL